MWKQKYQKNSIYDMAFNLWEAKSIKQENNNKKPPENKNWTLTGKQ